MYIKSIVSDVFTGMNPSQGLSSSLSLTFFKFTLQKAFPECQSPRFYRVPLVTKV